MGLSGSGKSSLSSQLHKELPSSLWLNADQLRKDYNDWDFSIEGRIRQAKRISKLSNLTTKQYVIADFIAPLPEQRDIFNADIIIWMNTIKSYKYEDTNQAFQAPDKYDIKFDSFNKIDVSKVLNIIKAYAYPFYK